MKLLKLIWYLIFLYSIKKSLAKINDMMRFQMRFCNFENKTRQKKENKNTVETNIFQQLLDRSASFSTWKPSEASVVPKSVCGKEKPLLRCLQMCTYMPPPAEAASVTGGQSGSHYHHSVHNREALSSARQSPRGSPGHHINHATANKRHAIRSRELQLMGGLLASVPAAWRKVTWSS